MPTQTGNLFWGQGEREYRLRVIEGRWPSDIDGAVYIVGPDKRRPGGHWFDGHGLIMKIGCRIRIGGEIGVTTRRVRNRTERLRERFPHLFLKSGPFEFSPWGASNLANTALGSMGGRLFVGYDGGLPGEIDPQLLEYIGDLAPEECWRPMIPGLPAAGIRVAAHFAVEPDDSAMYFANMAATTLPGRALPADIAKWDGRALRRWTVTGMRPYDTIHDVQVTEHHVIFMDFPMPMPMHRVERHFPKRDTTRLWLIKKSELVPERKTVRALEVEIPIPSSHFTADYLEPDGCVRVCLQHTSLRDPVTVMDDGSVAWKNGRPIPWDYWGMVSAPPPAVALGRYRVKTSTGEVIDRGFAENANRQWVFAASDNVRLEALWRQRKLYYASSGYDADLITGPTAKRPSLPPYVPGALAVFDLERMEMEQIYEYADGAFPHPPTFVPRIGSDKPDDGYVLVIAHKERPKEIQIFDAARIEDGPVACVTSATFNPSLALHSHWMEF